MFIRNSFHLIALNEPRVYGWKLWMSSKYRNCWSSEKEMNIRRGGRNPTAKPARKGWWGRGGERVTGVSHILALSLTPARPNYSVCFDERNVRYFKHVLAVMFVRYRAHLSQIVLIVAKPLMQRHCYHCRNQPSVLGARTYMLVRTPLI